MGITAQEIATVHITDSKGITVETVSHLKVALVVGTPDIVGFPCYGRRTSGMLSPESSFTASNKALPFQDISSC